MCELNREKPVKKPAQYINVRIDRQDTIKQTRQKQNINKQGKCDPRLNTYYNICRYKRNLIQKQVSEGV
jgi:hypothetical protein